MIHVPFYVNVRVVLGAKNILAKMGPCWVVEQTSTLSMLLLG